MDKLGRLVSFFEAAVNNNESREANIISTLKVDPTKILNALRNLASIVGCESAKQAVAEYVQMLVVSGAKNVDAGHCIITGSPGVGKTTLAIAIARVLGEFYQSRSSDVSVSTSDSENILANITEVSEALKTVSEAKRLVSNARRKTEDAVYSQELSAIAIAMDMVNHALCDVVSTLTANHATISLCETTETTENKEQSEVYTIVGKETFVGMWQGHTTEKTLEFLRQNVGKVIIVEEAYTLCTGPGDSYGSELLALINRHMTEHARENIFIFCGYSDLIERNLFSMQPGLRRRFSTRISIEGYTLKELVKIYISQINSDGWSSDEKMEADANEIFESVGLSVFPHFGGDTRRLVSRCKNIAAEKILYGDRDSGNADIDAKLIVNKTHLIQALSGF